MGICHLSLSQETQKTLNIVLVGIAGVASLVSVTALLVLAIPALAASLCLGMGSLVVIMTISAILAVVSAVGYCLFNQRGSSPQPRESSLGSSHSHTPSAVHRPPLAPRSTPELEKFKAHPEQLIVSFDLIERPGSLSNCHVLNPAKVSTLTPDELQHVIQDQHIDWIVYFGKNPKLESGGVSVKAIPASYEEFNWLEILLPVAHDAKNCLKNKKQFLLISGDSRFYVLLAVLSKLMDRIGGVSGIELTKCNLEFCLNSTKNFLCPEEVKTYLLSDGTVRIIDQYMQRNKYLFY